MSSSSFSITPSEKSIAASVADPTLENTSPTPESFSKPSDREFHELIRRLQPEERKILDVKMASTTEAGMREIADFLNKPGAFADVHLRERIFSDEMSPYHTLRAYKEGAISVDQLSTFQIHHHMMQHKKEELTVTPLFLSDGARNPEAEATVKASISDKTLADFKAPAPSANFTVRGLNPTEAQVDEIFEKAKFLPSSEQVLLSFPDTQEERIALMGGLQKLPRTISQATAQAGLTYMNRAYLGSGADERLVRLKPSMGLMKLSVDVVRTAESSTQIHPVFGLSSREDIHKGQEAGLRDMAIPFPGIELPNTADGFKAPLADGDFTDHDFYHAMTLAHIPDSYTHIFLEIYRALPGYNGQGSKAAQDLADNFLDLEVPATRFGGLARPEDRFWLGVITRIEVLFMEAVSRSPEVLAMLGLEPSALPPRFELLDQTAMSESFKLVGSTVRKLGGNNVNSADYLVETNKYLETLAIQLQVPKESLNILTFKLQALSSMLEGWESAASSVTDQ